MFELLYRIIEWIIIRFNYWFSICNVYCRKHLIIYLALYLYIYEMFISIWVSIFNTYFSINFIVKLFSEFIEHLLKDTHICRVLRICYLLIKCFHVIYIYMCIWHSVKFSYPLIQLSFSFLLTIRSIFNRVLSMDHSKFTCNKYSWSEIIYNRNQKQLINNLR